MSSKLESDVCCRLQVAPSGESYEGNRRPGRKQWQTTARYSVWRDSLHVTCGLTACTPGSAPGPTLGNEYGKTLPFFSCPPSVIVGWKTAHPASLVSAPLHWYRTKSTVNSGMIARGKAHSTNLSVHIPRMPVSASDLAADCCV